MTPRGDSFRFRPVLGKIVAIVTFLILGVTSLANADERKRAGPEGLWSHFALFSVVRALAFEGDILWVGTSNGILRYDLDTEQQTIYTTKDGLLSNIIHTIAIDPKGDKWVGTYGGGLSRFDGKSWTTFTPYGSGSSLTYGPAWANYREGRGLADLWVYGILFDPNGEIWLATWKGVSRFDGKSFKTYTTDDGLADKWVYTLSRDRDGVFWFGTEGGVTRFDGSRWKSWTHKEGIGAAPGKVKPPEAEELQAIPRHHAGGEKPLAYNPNYIVSSAVDAKNRLWVGTLGGGASRFDGRRWKTFTTEEGLAGNVVHAIRVDPKGVLWFGTDGGASRFDGEKFVAFGKKEGVGAVYSIAIDRRGKKWFGTFGGISTYKGE